LNRDGELDSVVIIALMGEHLLQDAEQALVARNGHDHGAQLHQDTLSFGDDDPLLMGRDRIQEFEEMLDIMDWEFNGHGKRVNSPTQDHIPVSPIGITFAHFLQ
jgi:hypothetical protein